MIEVITLHQLPEEPRRFNEEVTVQNSLHYERKNYASAPAQFLAEHYGSMEEYHEQTQKKMFLIMTQF